MMNEILTALGSATVLSLLTYFTKWQKGEVFDILKLLRTLLIGLALGIVAKLGGAELTAENWETYLAANAGIIAVIDQIIKAVGRMRGV